MASQASKLKPFYVSIVNPLLEQSELPWISNSKVGSFAFCQFLSKIDYGQAVNKFPAKGVFNVPSKNSVFGRNNRQVPFNQDDHTRCRFNSITSDYELQQDHKPHLQQHINSFPTLLGDYGHSWQEWSRENSFERRLERKLITLLEKQIRLNTENDVDLTYTSYLAAGTVAAARILAALPKSKLSA